jgi:hypothetical protein
MYSGTSLLKVKSLKYTIWIQLTKYKNKYIFGGHLGRHLEFEAFAHGTQTGIKQFLKLETFPNILVYPNLCGK